MKIYINLYKISNFYLALRNDRKTVSLGVKAAR